MSVASPPRWKLGPWCRRHYGVLAPAVLALAAFNLAFRLGSEFVNEWDESLYAISAWEMGQTGHLIGTTFLGSLDYYNTKPPLNVWLIAGAFKVLGRNLIALRLTSAVSAWFTVFLIQRWVYRVRGPLVSLITSTVLATTFGFIYVHAGRSAETDALFTLLITLTAYVLWAQHDNRWQAVWLGPLLAASFLLRGMAVLMPLSMVAVTAALTPYRKRHRWAPFACAAVTGVFPIAAWVLARFRLDGSLFLGRLFGYDFVARTVTVIEDHPGDVLYYFDVLHRHHYDWMVAAAVAIAIMPNPRIAQRLVALWHTKDPFIRVLAVWAAAAVIIPTVMSTKLPWYLNPFYPVFAIGVGTLIARASAAPTTGRIVILTVTACVALGTAEGKLMWNSFVHRDLSRSAQGLLLQGRDALHGHRVFRPEWSRAELFVAGAIVGADSLVVDDLVGFLRNSRVGDFWLSPVADDCAELTLVAFNTQGWLYQRAE